MSDSFSPPPRKLNGFYGSLRFSVFRRNGLDDFDISTAGLARSFLVLFVVTLLFPIATSLLPFTSSPIDINDFLFEELSVTLSVTIFLICLVMAALLLKRRSRLASAIIATNWSFLLTSLVLFSLFLLINIEGIPLEMGYIIIVFFSTWMFFYIVYILHVTLDLNAWTAIGFLSIFSGIDYGVHLLADIPLH